MGINKKPSKASPTKTCKLTKLLHAHRDSFLEKWTISKIFVKLALNRLKFKQATILRILSYLCFLCGNSKTELSTVIELGNAVSISSTPRVSLMWQETVSVLFLNYFGGIYHSSSTEILGRCMSVGCLLHCKHNFKCMKCGSPFKMWRVLKD